MDLRPPVWQILLTVAAGLWLVVGTVATSVVIYGLDLFAVALHGDLAPGWGQVLTTSVAAVLVTVPVALLARLPRSAAVRAVGRLWTWAGVAFAVLGAARLVPADSHELYLLLLVTSALVVAVLLRRAAMSGRAVAGPGPAPRPAAPPARPAVLAAALAGGLAMLLPWAWAGALGGAVETVLAAASAGAVGAVAGGLLSRVRVDGPWHRRVLLGGLIATVALTPLAAATGETGVSLAAPVVVPLLGFAAVALGRYGGLLVGLAAAGPLLFVDPEETSAVLGTSDVGFWALVASAVGWVVAVLVGVGSALTYGRDRVPHRLVAAGAAVALAAALAGVYAVAGQPGLHGERLFVVLDEQADLTGVTGDRDARLREVYRRLVDTAERTQGPLRRELRRLGVDFRPYYLVNGVEVSAGPALRGYLAGRDGVDRVLVNPVLRPLPAAPEPMRGRAGSSAGAQWNLSLVGADRVWAELGSRGAGVVVGSSDSGVDGGHPALSDGFRGGTDSWYDPWNGTGTPTDRNGHGTHTLGSAVGGEGIGVAPDASWVGCVNLDRNLGSPARYLDCLQFMLAPFPAGGDPLRDGRPERAPHVLTNSWGCPRLEGCDGRVLTAAVTALTTAGIFFVSAAGNTGPACGSLTDEPATVPDSFTVAAVDAGRKVTGFSSRGPGRGVPDIAAPGADVRSALPGGGYGRLSGTSMAAPHVAGVVALMWAANPRLVGEVDRTARILRDTAGPATLPTGTAACGGATTVVGAGLVDAYAAVTAARAVT